jgi:hypothetical protein
MNIEINYEPLDLKNIMVKDFGEEVEKLRNRLNYITIDFSSINTIKGEKTLLEQSFQDTKKQILEYYG